MDGPLLAVQLGLLVLIYGWIAIGLPDRGGTSPSWFMAAIAVCAAAVVSPLDGAAQRSLTAHMIQHVLLISVVAPLLAAAHPLAVARARLTSRRTDRNDADGRPRQAARRGQRSHRSPWVTLAAAAVVQVVVLLAWHVPAAFDSAVRHPLLHGVEHVTLVLSAWALWAALLRLPAAGSGGAVVALFVTTLPAMAYGVALTLARRAWYAPYRHDSALRDQQLAGVVMWAYGGAAAVVGGVALGVAWLRAAERSAPGWPPAAGAGAGAGAGAAR